MASDILGLFTTPQQYEQQRLAAMEAQALQSARLSPMEQGQFGIALGAQQLGRAIGGALGGVDPQLQKITQRQQLLGMIDPSNPNSYAQAIQTALQTGDQEAAFLLRNEMMKAQEQAAVAENRKFEREGRLIERKLGEQERNMKSMASMEANGIDPETGLYLNKPLVDPVTQEFNQEVANKLISKYGQYGADIVRTRLESAQGIGTLQEKQVARTQEQQIQNLSKALIAADGSMDEKVYADLMSLGEKGQSAINRVLESRKLFELRDAQKLAENLYDPTTGEVNITIRNELQRTPAGREVLKGLKPETKELKKGEKLLERQPDGTWKIITPEGQPVQTTSSDNAIQSLIAGNAIHPTVLPYANQLAKNFANLDFEEQNVLMEKLTKLNSDAQRYASEKNARDQSRDTTNALKELNIELAKLKIKQAESEANKAKDGKPINFSDSTKLANQSTGVDKLVDLYESFKPEFAGFGTNAVGEVAVFAAGKQSDEKSVALYQWWQNYQNNVNKVRNDLFGSALTAPEKAEFEKAMVTKGMDSVQAQANLRRQAEEAAKAYEKLDKILRSQGFSQSALDSLKPRGIRASLSNFVIERDNTNPSNITGGKR